MEQNMPEERMGISKVVIVIVILLIAGIVYWVINSRESSSPTLGISPTTTPIVTPTVSPTKSGTPTTTPTNQSAVKTFTVTASNFAFSLKEIKVKKGDNVKIILQNTGGTHDWVIDEFNARIAQIGNGQTATVEFTADKTGRFEYYCSVGTHRAMGMKGTLIVE